MSQLNEAVKSESEVSDIPTILCVDDESNILSALRRLLRPHGYKLLLAESGAEGLSLLEKEPVDLVISDMRMPEMDGARFLTEVSERWPETMRILLTGYSDIASTIEAINKAQIFKYISKPWEDNDILISIQRALELKNLKRDRERLEKLTLKQNDELKDLNSNLELKVKARTAEIEQTLDMYEMANEELKDSYSTIIEVFSNLIAMRHGDSGSEIRQIADIAKSVSMSMGMGESEALDVYHAALLKDVGLIGFPDDMIKKPFSLLTSSEKEKLKQHPVIAQGLLMSLEPLQSVAHLIRCSRELFNGSGYPDGLGVKRIPLGARILCVIGDYFDLLKGTLTGEKLNSVQARQYIQEHSNTRYDPDVVSALPDTLSDGVESQSKVEKGEVTVTTEDLKPDMVLVADLMSSGGLVLLPKGYVVNDEVVNRIKNLEKSIGENFEIRVTTA